MIQAQDASATGAGLIVSTSNANVESRSQTLTSLGPTGVRGQTGGAEGAKGGSATIGLLRLRLCPCSTTHKSPFAKKAFYVYTCILATVLGVSSICQEAFYTYATVSPAAQSPSHQMSSQTSHPLWARVCRGWEFSEQGCYGALGLFGVAMCQGCASVSQLIRQMLQLGQIGTWACVDNVLCPQRLFHENDCISSAPVRLYACELHEQGACWCVEAVAVAGAYLPVASLCVIPAGGKGTLVRGQHASSTYSLQRQFSRVHSARNVESSLTASPHSACSWRRSVCQRRAWPHEQRSGSTLTAVSARRSTLHHTVLATLGRERE